MSIQSTLATIRSPFARRGHAVLWRAASAETDRTARMPRTRALRTPGASPGWLSDAQVLRAQADVMRAIR
ncbi:MAG: hypothetical protein MUF35_01540 [Candidatus Nanopelagicales bacterium]|jgi:hypothetical protein|nr:hypothetical protein [Candidatus Nanopelagicales bacterium]